MMFRKPKCRIGYRVVFSGKYKGLADSDEVFVDSDNNDDVLYLFHVYLDNPDVTIYVCYHDGTEKKIVLKKSRRRNKK
jgi:hypothetical protein